jgi:hypothetical protein
MNIFPLEATRLADGLGPEVISPTFIGFAPKDWVPRSPSVKKCQTREIRRSAGMGPV